MPRVSIHTLGCKLNFAETAAIGQQFLDRGFELVEFGREADVCVINTCTVTEHADRECRQIIRRALRSPREPLVVVTGCYAQLTPEEIASIEGVGLVLGAREKFDLFKYLPEARKGSAPAVFVSDIGMVDDFGPAYSTAAVGRTRAVLKIQDGCDYTCAFCTIPLARGASRSQSEAETVEQARMLVASGYKEIVLTGVNVGDYGRKTGEDLLALLKQLVALEGLRRLRISSIEPNLLSEELIDFARESPVLCNHFHIPLQSGDDEILRRMRRRYTAGRYEELIERVKERIPDCGIGVDVIVGFPGETQSHFERTYELLNRLPISYLHVFTYSQRPNTPAAEYEGAVDVRERKERNNRLRMLSQKKRHAFYESLIGRSVEVLTEGDCERGLRFGFTGEYARVGLPAGESNENSLVRVEVTSLEEDFLLGRLAGTAV
jgi:threonylcarbamoyladenosine tRNA methylthiotransferase MtaB